MRYFIRINDDVESKEYTKPLALYRFEFTGTKAKLITEWWNPKQKKWEFSNSVMDAFGLGGAENYIEVDVKQAMEFQKSSPRKVDV